MEARDNYSIVAILKNGEFFGESDPPNNTTGTKSWRGKYPPGQLILAFLIQLKLIVMKLKVVSSNPSSNGGFINKLVHEEVVTMKVFGVSKTTTQQSTFYMKTDEALPIGAEDEINLSLFDIVERPFVPETPRTTDANGRPLRPITPGAPIYLRWLVSKVANRVAVTRRIDNLVSNATVVNGNAAY